MYVIVRKYRTSYELIQAHDEQEMRKYCIEAIEPDETFYSEYSEYTTEKLIEIMLEIGRQEIEDIGCGIGNVISCDNCQIY